MAIDEWGRKRNWLDDIDSAKSCVKMDLEPLLRNEDVNLSGEALTEPE